MPVRLNNPSAGSSSTPTLQQVTDEGNTTTNTIGTPAVKDLLSNTVLDTVNAKLIDSTNNMSYDINARKTWTAGGIMSGDFSDGYKVLLGNGQASCSYSVTLGGSCTLEQNTVAIGQGNCAINSYSTSIGTNNTASGYAVGGATIIGGKGNNVSSDYSNIIGGECNTISNIYQGYNSINGGKSNSICGDYSTINGGMCNMINASYSNSHVLGSNITANTSNTTFVNSLRLVDDISTISTPVEGQLGFDYINHVLKYYNGTAWV